MPLKTVVKVGNISNLSDARYCAGMGVDMLGFSVVAGTSDYVLPKLFQEIRGWVSGPRFVAQIYGLQSHEALPEIIRNYAPDYFELDAQAFRQFAAHLSLPCIIAVTKDELASLQRSDNIAYFLVDETALSSAENNGNALLLKVDSATGLPEKLAHHNVTGVALNGSPEIRPGFKDYSELSDILEMLDE
jgi:phosphoribosylanthranilate isomerase